MVDIFLVKPRRKGGSVVAKATTHPEPRSTKPAHKGAFFFTVVK
jgi:hypothetical protein